MPVNVLTQRLGVFVELAEALNENLGRTSLMKFCYFLQALKRVPLNYEFSLYSYGPFDSEVLSDLQTAEDMNILQADVEQYPGGYRYRIKPSENGNKARGLANEFLAKYKKDIEWVISLFGNRSAGDLELLSTILFVYEKAEVRDREQLVDCVNSLKPHFSISKIGHEIEWLEKNKLLK